MCNERGIGNLGLMRCSVTGMLIIYTVKLHANEID